MIFFKVKMMGIMKLKKIEKIKGNGEKL